MRELHLYVANDGTEFEDEQECLAYETAKTAKTLKGKVALLGADFKVIPLNILEEWDRAYFIFVKDVSALHELRDVWDWDLTGLYPPDFLNGDTAGLFAYDGDDDEWYHMGARLQILQNIVDKVMRVVNENM